MSEQVTIDSLEFAQRGKDLHGKIAVADMDRLQEHLHSSSGELHYTLLGRIGENGKPRLVCRINGELTLKCQRCLGALAFPVAIESTLELVKEGENFLPLEDEDDSIDTIPTDSAMDVRALIEEEVMLSLPLAAMHTSGECGAAGRLRAPGKTNPFEVLAALKKNG